MKLRRRYLLFLALLLVALIGLLYFQTRPAPILTVMTWPGAYGRAQAAAQMRPYGAEHDVDVRPAIWDGDLAEAHAPMSVTLVLNHELDISRGDLIVAADDPATVVKRVKAALVWMDQRPLDRHRRYLLKHTSHTVPAYVSAVEHRTNIGTLTHEPAEMLEMNGIGVVSIQLLRPIALDLYGENRSTGAFILIDPESNSTVAAGMVTATPTSASSGSAVTRTARTRRRIKS